MKVVISDFLTAECEFSGKSDAECVCVCLDETTPEAVISTAELFKWLRFKKKQEEKQQDSKRAVPRSRQPAESN